MKAELMPTPRDEVLRDGTARVYRFRRAEDRPAGPGMPLLLVPSMINRWYVVDLRPGVSLAGALAEAGFDTFCLDWGIPEDEDRHRTWEDAVDRLARTVRRVKRETGAQRVGVLGYCMGGTLSGIFAALWPDDVAALVNLAGPFDFAEGGALARMVDPRWFDADTVADAGNVHPRQMQSGFVALRPTTQLAKWVTLLHRSHDPRARRAFEAVEAWAGDNIPFPAEAYRTYIRELYQDNALVRGKHRIRGRRVDLGSIRCPVLTVAAERDTICPLPAARALNDHAGSADTDLLVIPGGHVGAVVGSRAPKELYPAITAWLKERLCNSTS